MKVRQLVSYRKDFVEDLQILLKDMQECVLINNQDEKYNENIVCDEPIQKIPEYTDYIKAQICFSSAMILSQQMGYESLNRNQIIGNLALCQHYLYRNNYQIATELRDVRHLVQNNKQRQIIYDWYPLCNKIDKLVQDSLL